MAEFNSQLDAFIEYYIEQERPAHRPIGPALPALGHAISGSAGSAISNVIVYPLNLVITRLQVQRQFAKEKKEGDDDEEEEYKNIIDAVQKIYEREGGIKAFYSGLLQDTAKSVADSFFFFLAYTFLKETRKRRNGVKKLSTIDEIGVGMVAGAFSKLLTTPMQQIVTRKQTAAMLAARSPGSTISPNLSTRDIALQIRDEKGIRGFWAGYSASLFLTLNPALTMLFHQTFLRTLVPHSRRSDPGGKITFLLAALSKALASTITYPFSLAKTRAQVARQEPEAASLKGSEDGSAGSTPAKSVKRNTIFSSILDIVRKEGLAGLYQGVEGEVLKGFFSHGLTMLMKERIHGLVIQLYYLVLKALKKYPSPEELAQRATQQLETAKENVEEKAAEIVAYAKDSAQTSTENAGEVVQSGMAKAETIFESAKHSIAEGVHRARELATEAIEKAQEVFKDDDSMPAGDVYGKDIDGNDIPDKE